jgi:hypothetical protein
MSFTSLWAKPPKLGWAMETAIGVRAEPRPESGLVAHLAAGDVCDTAIRRCWGRDGW